MNLNPYNRTPVPFWGQFTYNLSTFCPHTYRSGKGGEEPATWYVTPDLSYELDGEREGDVRRLMNGMRKKEKKKNGSAALRGLSYPNFFSVSPAGNNIWWMKRIFLCGALSRTRERAGPSSDISTHTTHTSVNKCITMRPRRRVCRRHEPLVPDAFHITGDHSLNRTKHCQKKWLNIIYIPGRFYV